MRVFYNQMSSKIHGMLSLITLSILLLASLTLSVLRVVRRGFDYSWLVAALGCMTAWLSVLFWQLDLAQTFSILPWTPQTLFRESPSFTVDAVTWVYALALLSVAAAIILTAPAQATGISPTAWIGVMGLTVIGLLAFMADNPLTLVLIWSALDLAELTNTLRLSQSAAASERAVTAFGIRVLGTGFALWASLDSASAGTQLVFAALPPTTGIFLLLAVGLRLGVLPLHLPYHGEPGLRRGLGTCLRLTAAASSLVLLARIKVTVADPAGSALLTALLLLAAVYGGWKWLTSPGELNGRPYWLIGLGAFSMIAALQGNPIGSAAWGSALVLFGGLVFLYSARHIRYNLALALAGLGLVGLPFSLTASIGLGSQPLAWFFWPFFIAAHVFLIMGYLRHLLRPGENLAELPRWAQVAYPFGFAIPIVSMILLGLWGWPGSLTVGNWPAALLTLGFGMAGLVIFWRIPSLLPTNQTEAPEGKPQISRLIRIQEAFFHLLSILYKGLRYVVVYISGLLEGDGGLLWTLLILVLLLSIFRGGG